MSAPIGIVTGSGTYALPQFEDPAAELVETPFGEALVTRGRFAGVEVLHLSRHGEGHVRLSNNVNHRANVWALKQLGAAAVIGCTACGALEPDIAMGQLIVFDELHFLANRLPDGSLCTFYGESGHRERGHWIYGDPFSEALRGALLAGAREIGHEARERGCYGHVDGPRFNTRAEIAALAALGVTAVSQTGGPETTLCGEAELPYALIGYATDYANGVTDEATPVEDLIRLMGESSGLFSTVLGAALPRLAGQELKPTGTVYRFEQG